MCFTLFYFFWQTNKGNVLTSHRSARTRSNSAQQQVQQQQPPPPPPPRLRVAREQSFQTQALSPRKRYGAEGAFALANRERHAVGDIDTYAASGSVQGGLAAPPSLQHQASFELPLLQSELSNLSIYAEDLALTPRANNSDALLDTAGPAPPLVRRVSSQSRFRYRRENSGLSGRRSAPRTRENSGLDQYDDSSDVAPAPVRRNSSNLRIQRHASHRK